VTVHIAQSFHESHAQSTGHPFVLHWFTSSALPSHSLPPQLEFLETSRARFCFPPPHVFEH
jgi:hypothetical protein